MPGIRAYYGLRANFHPKQFCCLASLVYNDEDTDRIDIIIYRKFVANIPLHTAAEFELASRVATLPIWIWYYVLTRKRPL